MIPSGRLYGLMLALLLAFSSADSQTLSLEQRVFILSKTYETIPLQFAHWRDASFKPQQLDSVYKVFLKRAIAAESRKEFTALMEEFIALLSNSHTWYNDSKVYGAVLPMGFYWKYLDGKWVVTSSSIAGLQPGDVVLKIDGKSVDEHYKEQSKYLAASNERARRIRFRGWLGFVLPSKYLIEVQAKSGKVNQLSIDRETIKAPAETPKTESKWLLADKIAYIRIPSFNKPEYENGAIDQLKEYQNAPALIIDVRANGGGSTPERLVKALMNKSYRWQTEGTPLNVGLFRYYSEARPDIELNDYFRNAQLTWQSAEIPPDSGIYAGALIILTDRVTGSAAEDFTMPFKDNGRALIIGETTNGSTGQPYMYGFGDGITIGIGTKRTFMPTGAEFEGIGIQPDIFVPLQREDLYSGNDRVLERAMAEAERVIRK